MDFSYGGKTINSGGPIKPSGINQPLDPRTEVKLYADIENIPSPYVGMIITVLEDETNSNKMTDYKVLSLKANSLGVANSVVDQVQRYVDYLGVSGGSSGGGSGLTSEQTQQLQTAYEHSQSTHVTSDDLLNIDAVSLNGKKFSEPMTKVEYDAIDNKDSNTIYLIDDDYSVIGVPNFTQTDTGKYLAVNSDGTALAWVNAPSGSGNTSTIEIINDLTTGGTDKALSAEQGKILKNEVNTVISDYLGNKKLIYLTQTEYNSLTEEEKKDESVVYNITDAPSGTFDGILTSENGTKFKLVVSNDGTLSTEAIRETIYGEIVLDKTSLSLNEGETGTFTVSLDKAPTSEEAISISVANSNCTVNPSSLSFTSSNYSNAQEVNVTAIHDSLSYENKTDTIILSNDNVSNKSVSVTILNIDTKKTLSSISAVYTQGDTVVYPSTSLNSLKSNLVVTATYNDGSSNVVTDYTLSGTLVTGTSTITVTYNEKTTTFNVTVSEEPVIGDSTYYVNLDFNDNSNSPIIHNLADSNHNASIKETSLLSWENGVARITTNTASNEGLMIRDADTITNEMSIEIVFQCMNETLNGSTILKMTGLASETITSQIESAGIRFYVRAYNDGNKAHVTWFLHECNMLEKYHVLLSLKSGEIVLYINGSEVKRVDNTYTNLSMQLIEVAQYNFDGTVELFKIYKKALSSSEVTSAYNNYLNK